MSRLEAPRRVLLGRLRHRVMLVRAFIAWWPVAVVLIAVAAYWMDYRRLEILGVSLMVASVEWRHRGIVAGRFRAAWHRTMWWADARAGGLVVIADPSVNAVHERGGSHAVGLELAPALRRIRVRRTSRLYVLRSLPGQTFDDFQLATPALAHRWGGQVAVAEHPSRRRTILMEVSRGDVLAQPLAHSQR